MKISLIIGCFLLLSACGPIRPNPTGWTEKTIETKYLSFQIWEKDIQAGQPIRIYIEGDGDPMPDKPIALTFAEKDTAQNVIYLSRPCQYVWCQECKNPALWQEERFNEEIVDEMARVIRHFERKYQTADIDLIGYDGGGTMALLVSSKVPVKRVITIGGILDTQKYSEVHRIKLNGMKPSDVENILEHIPQIHYVGENDKDAPRQQAEHFVHKFKKPKSIAVKIVPDATHTNWEHLIIEQ